MIDVYIGVLNIWIRCYPKDRDKIDRLVDGYTKSLPPRKTAVIHESDSDVLPTT